MGTEAVDGAQTVIDAYTNGGPGSWGVPADKNLTLSHQVLPGCYGVALFPVIRNTL